MKSVFTIPARLITFYRDGFREMSSWGKRVWIIILIKLFIILAVLKLFFFPDFLKKTCSTDSQRSEYVLEMLTRTTDD
jgi:hypothetical protein